ncbi:hypothetical protein Tco_0476035 [Tanacetum coccineum]
MFVKFIVDVVVSRLLFGYWAEHGGVKIGCSSKIVKNMMAKGLQHMCSRKYGCDEEAFGGKARDLGSIREETGDKNATFQAHDFHCDAYTKSAQKVRLMAILVYMPFIDCDTASFHADHVVRRYGNLSNEMPCIEKEAQNDEQRHSMLEVEFIGYLRASNLDDACLVMMTL